MDKASLEKLFLDCERLKKFCEHIHACKPCLSLSSPQPDTSQINTVEPPANMKPPTAEEIRSNFPRFQTQDFSGDVLDLMPSLDGKDPREALELLVARYRKHPSVRNAALVEGAINRLYAVGAPDKNSGKLIDDAVQTLSQKVSDNSDESSDPKKQFTGDDIRCWLYEDRDFGGRILFFSEFFGVIYKAISDLPSPYRDSFSSIQVGASTTEVGGTVLLFENDRYFGRYARFDATPGAIVNTRHVGGFIEDRTSSVLLVRRFDPELPPMPLGNLVSKDEIKDLVKSKSGIRPRGEPVITWDMWPTGPEQGGYDTHPNAPDMAYVALKIPITVDVPNWVFDYDAEIRYWLYLYVDAAGVLQGYVNQYGAWVEGGILTGSVLSELMGRLPPTVDDVNSRLAAALALANLAGPFGMLYYLPGRFDSQGSTDDDVTVVLTRGGPPPDDGPIL